MADTLCVDDNSAGDGEAKGFYVVNNWLVSEADNGTITNVIDCNPDRACDNKVTGTTDPDYYPDFGND